MFIKKSNFKPAPAGIHVAVLVDVVDLGLVRTRFGERDKLKLVWELKGRMPEGKPWMVSKTYSKSLHKKASLAQDLVAWFGEGFAKVREIDLDQLIGKTCDLVIVHNRVGDAVYANVSTIVPTDEKLTPSGSYVRIQDRPGYQPPPGASVATPAAADESDYQAESDKVDEPDIPF